MTSVIGCAPTLHPQSSDPSSTEGQIEASELARLDKLIGRFLRRDITVYRGTLDGGSTATTMGAPDPSVSGAALAMLDIRQSYSADWWPQTTVPVLSQGAFLVVHSLASAQHVIYAQSAQDLLTTWATLMSPDNSTSGLLTSCTGCAPRLFDAPGVINLPDFRAGGTASVYIDGRNVDENVSSFSTLQLAVADPCTLTWDELVTLNTAQGPDSFSADFALQSFTQIGTGVGTQMVSHHKDLWGGPTERGQCALATPYQLDVWVDRDEPANAGTRAFQADAPMMICLSTI